MTTSSLGEGYEEYQLLQSDGCSTDEILTDRKFYKLGRSTFNKYVCRRCQSVICDPNFCRETCFELNYVMSFRIHIHIGYNNLTQNSNSDDLLKALIFRIANLHTEN
jgi:hypothetical protein